MPVDCSPRQWTTQREQALAECGRACRILLDEQHWNPGSCGLESDHQRWTNCLMGHLVNAVRCVMKFRLSVLPTFTIGGGRALRVRVHVVCLCRSC
jgi:hypothetical protein